MRARGYPVGTAAETFTAVTSIAIIGASEHSFMCRLLMGALRAYGFRGAVFPVHPQQREVFGHAAYPTVADLPEAPSIAILVLRADRCLAVTRSLYERGCRFVVVYSDGFAETGTPEGAELQRELRSYCALHGIALIGPNCVGFADFQHGVAAMALPLSPGIRPGRVSAVAQSGALLFSIVSGLQRERVGVDLAISIGNSAGLDVVDALELCLSRPRTDVVCAYVESFGTDMGRLERVLHGATAAGKRVIVVSAGTSEIGRRIALSHTASIVGASRYVDALCDRHGLLRVSGIEDMVRTAALAELVPAGGVGPLVLTTTGGGAGLAGDLADRAGLMLAEIGAGALDRLGTLVPRSGFLGNPMDLSAQAAGRGVNVIDIYDALLAGRGGETVMFIGATGYPDDTPQREVHRVQLEDLAVATEKHGLRLLFVGVVDQPWTDWMLAFLDRHPRAAAVCGISSTMAAMGLLQRGRAAPDSGRRLPTRSGSVPPPQPAAPAQASEMAGGRRHEVLDEAAGRHVLRQIGFPLVPGSPTGIDPDEAVAAADTLGYPVVVKGVVPGLSHKSAAGAVALGLSDPASVRRACDDMRDRFAVSGSPPMDGFLIERMVSGVEFIAGLTRDEIYGPALTFGIGGALAETTGLNATMLLPVDGPEVLHRLIDNAGLDPLLRRLGAAPYALMTRVLAMLCEEFVNGHLAGFTTVEINPLFVTPAGELLAGDVLLVRPITVP